MIHPQYLHRFWQHMGHFRILVRHWSRGRKLPVGHLRWAHRLLRRPGR